MAQLVASMSGVVLGVVIKVVGAACEMDVAWAGGFPS